MYCVCLFQFPRSLNFVAFIIQAACTISASKLPIYMQYYYGVCRCFQLWLLLPMCYSLLTTDCVVSSWRRSVRAWRVCSTASSCPRGSRCRPRHVMFVVTLLCPGWPRTCRTRQTSRWWTVRTRWGRHQPSCDVPLFCPWTLPWSIY